MSGMSCAAVARQRKLHPNTIKQIVRKAGTDDLAEKRRHMRMLVAARCSKVIERVINRIGREYKDFTHSQLLFAGKTLAEMYKALHPPDVLNEVHSDGGDIYLDTGLPEPVTEDDGMTVADAQDSTLPKPS